MKVSTILKQQNNTPADDKIKKKKKTLQISHAK